MSGEPFPQVRVRPSLIRPGTIYVGVAPAPQANRIAIRQFPIGEPELAYAYAAELVRITGFPVVDLLKEDKT